MNELKVVYNRFSKRWRNKETGYLLNYLTLRVKDPEIREDL